MSNVLQQHATGKDPLRASCTQIARVPAQVGPGQPAIKESPSRRRGRLVIYYPHAIDISANHMSRGG
jgi:hypothetical protein